MSGGDELAIQGVIEKLINAWNHRDWLSFSRLFADDAEYVTGAAIRLSGRERILEEMSSRELSDAAGQVSLVTESLRILRPEVAVVLCKWQIESREGPRTGLLTMVMQSSGDSWRIVALHNTDGAV